MEPQALVVLCTNPSMQQSPSSLVAWLSLGPNFKVPPPAVGKEPAGGEGGKIPAQPRAWVSSEGSVMPP